MTIKYPEIGSIWEHTKTGKMYIVTDIIKTEPTKDKYSMKVVYKNYAPSWEKSVAAWNETMELVFNDD